MLKLCVLATTLVIVISTPLQKNNIEKPHVRVKRTGEHLPVVEDNESEEKRSRLGFKPDDVKQAEEDQLAVVQTEIFPAEDISSEPDVIGNSKEEKLEDVLVPTETETQGDAKEPEAALQDQEVEKTLVNLLEKKEPDDPTGSEEDDLKKLMPEETDNTLTVPVPDGEHASGEDDKLTDATSSSRHKGRYSDDYFYDVYYPFGYRRKRGTAKRPLATAEDMMMGGTERVRPGGRRIKRDLKKEELRTLLQGGATMNDYGDYPDYPLVGDYDDYSEYEPDYEKEEKVAKVENDLANLIANLEEQGYSADYTDYPTYQQEYEYQDYYDPRQAYTEYGYPEGDELTMREKLALLGYLQNKEIENEERYPYVPYGQYNPSRELDYPEMEQRYEDPRPVNRVYKRQYRSFVPGSKRSGQFYAVPDVRRRGLMDLLAEQKRNELEYERLLTLAEALNGPQGYYDDYKKK